MKIKTVIGIYLYIFMIICMIIPIYSYYSIFDDLIRSLIYVSVAGGIGATLYCIRGFYQNIADGEFDSEKWVWWYIFRPLIGFVAGIFIYFILGGLIGLNSVELTFTSGGIMAYCALAFLTGFSFTHFANKLETILKTIF